MNFYTKHAYKIIDFPHHKKHKNKLLEFIKNDPIEEMLETAPKKQSYNGTDDAFDNSQIFKLDWMQHKNQHRPWVKSLLPDLLSSLRALIVPLGFNDLDLRAIWYQQYLKTNRHDWHYHSEHYTGVYYLELPEGAPGTALYDNETGKIYVPKVNEGDLCIFPAMTIHKGMELLNAERKTVISYNFNLINISMDKRKELRDVESNNTER